MNVSPKSTNQIRMIAVDVVRQQAETCAAKRENNEDKIDALAEMVALQMKIVWGLLLMIVSGLLGVAFSVWGGGP